MLTGLAGVLLSAGSAGAMAAGEPIEKGNAMSNDQGFYLCAMTPEPGGGIFRYRLNADRHPEQLSFAPLAGSNYLAFSPDRKTLYSTCIIDQAGGVAAFRIHPDGSLALLNQLPSRGKSTCYVIAAPSGKYLYCANYSSGSITEFSLNADGSLKALERLIEYHGSGRLPRQSTPHPHFTNITPDGKYLCVTDLGLDTLTLYPFEDATGRIKLESPHIFKVEPAGSGPRHLLFNRKGDRAYLLNELGNTVIVLKYSGGRFESMQLLPTLPADCPKESKAAAIRLSPDGRFLYASNRGYDSVAVYEVKPEDGTLIFRELVESGGSSPRDINFLPGGRAFATANEFSDRVVFFDFDAATGKITPSGETVTMPRPLAIYW